MTEPEPGPVVEPPRERVDLGLNEPEVETAAEAGIRVDPMEKQREKTRRWLASGIFSAAVGVGIFYAIASMILDSEDWKQASGVFNTVFTALVGLAGTAVGYYFSKSQ